ncbi:MAG: GAF domain-containing protein [Anaerolineales bacterium]|nr:GAF domain-containing protein [Anaerolineales bacterium]MCB0005818.1 GAF domain-containing protein [Anaerolineales bacterium]MCB0011804.1 GAF domain-containing protein [Anaerolineales bacterium]MCB0017870.1 GAF domain-containing protein [Anaerolineales bacterium]MCB8962985.1 GAF domain-containing protein [Ardenticatenales bacterium]
MSIFTDKLTESEPKSESRLQLLYSVNHMLRQVEADGLDIHIILPRILKLSVRELGAFSGSIFVIDERLHVEHAWHITENQEETIRTGFTEQAMAQGLARWVVENQHAATIHNTLEDARWLSNPSSPSSREAWSALSVPLITRARVVGVITITTPGQNQFDQADLDMLEAIASQAAITIASARLYSDSQRRLRVTSLLFEASQVINSSLDIDRVMASLLGKMNELLNVESLSIALVDNRTNELVFQVSAGDGGDDLVGLRLPADRGISGWVMSHGEPQLVNDPSADSRFNSAGDARTGVKTRAIICAPIKSQAVVLGTLQAINPASGHFTEDDLALLVNLANLAASAFANANQFAATQAAEARYLSLFEDNIDPILLTTTTGKIIEVNRKACDFLGYERAELLTMNISALHPTDTAAQFSQSERAKGALLFTTEVVTKDERIIPVEVHGKNIQLDDEEIFQWIQRDITEQVELEEMRTDLTAMLFHDLQSPLGNVLSSLELLEMELGDNNDETIKTLLDIAAKSSRGLQALIRSLLDINRLEAGQAITSQVWVDLPNLVASVIPYVTASMERREIELKVDLTAHAPSVYVDEDMIRRVLVNLLDNSIKYTPRGKVVTITLVESDEPGRLCLAVQDQGNGIPENYKRTIFDKFRRVKEKGGPSGLGLGLAFCRLAVEAHGGRIWVEDRDTGGASFQFTLPSTPEQNPFI